MLLEVWHPGVSDGRVSNVAPEAGHACAGLRAATKNPRTISRCPCAVKSAQAHLLGVSACEEDGVLDLRSPEYWDIRDIQFQCRVSRSTAWRMVRESEFPEPVVYGKKCVLWPREEVVRFLEGRRDPGHYAPPTPTPSPTPSFSSRSLRARSRRP